MPADWWLTMDPLSIAASSASVAALCGQAVYTLSKWASDVAGIDAVVTGLQGEIESLKSVIQSLGAATQSPNSGLSGILKTAGGGSGNALWIQVCRSIADAERVLRALNAVMLKFDAKSSGIFSKVRRQFKMSLESGEIASLRQRLTLLNTALNLPLQMLSL